MANFKRKFGRGRGGGGNGIGRGAGHSEPNRRICHHYQRGTCTFGSRCRFSHDLSSAEHQHGVSTQRNGRAEETAEEQDARIGYSAWRRLIRRMPLPNDLQSMRDVWDGALEILNSDDRERKQTLAKDLDDDEYYGRQHIKALMDQRAQLRQYDLFIEASQSFFLVMTHTALVDCLSVDTYVGSLYSFISGANGTRAIPFFQHICEIVATIRAGSSPAILLSRLDSTLIALLDGLSAILQRESRARYNEDLLKLIDSLETAAELIKGDRTHTSTVTSDTVLDRTASFRAVVARASGLLSEETGPDSEGRTASTLYSAYPRDVVMPGGRHDNDKADISQIGIFPTRAEIMSDARDFLPSTDPDQPHFLAGKMERHLDTQFRLLRHDTMGNLKEAVGSLMRQITNDPNQLTDPKLSLGDTRVYTYANAFVSLLLLNPRGGLQARMSFPQPHSIRKNATVDKRKWWEESRRLEEGILLSFIWMQGSTVLHQFFTVAERSIDTKNEASLTHKHNMATITVKLAAQDKTAVESLLDLSRQKTYGILLEFPNVLPATFVPVLGNLQTMQRQSRLPFLKWILPDPLDCGPRVKLDTPPPLYARNAGFTFPLTTILKRGAAAVSLHSSSSEDDALLVAQLEARTELDHGQCMALIAALTREFAFVQGPPGTGKSYLGVKLMKVLLDVKQKADLGPVIVVCYTNHALDQFLEHLIKDGIRKIIRVGGQSKSDLLENHNLRTITKTETKSKHESWQAASSYGKLGEYEEKSKRILGRLHGIQKRVEWKQLEHFLSRRYRPIYSQFKSVDNEGFTTVGDPFEIWAAGGKFSHTFRVQLGSASTTSEPASITERAVQNVHSLSYSERRTLIGLWTKEIQDDAIEEFFDLIQEAEKTQHDLTNVHEEINRRVLQGADVIGLTTSGLAKNISTLHHVRSKIIICEEAGEVMEPHMISVMLPWVEHFIQIGDHQQLRPSINNFHDLSLESDQGRLHQLDRSQFERLSIGERGRPSMPVAQLNVQRRMRPDIATLIRETIYPKLIDHPSTAQLPDVVGMRGNVFWLDHENLEDEAQPEVQHKKSKSNVWETEMVHALVRHLVRQGVYASSDIAVLTPYTGQLQKLRTAMRNDFEIVLSERDQDALFKDGFTMQESDSDQPSAEQSSKRKPLEKKKLSDLLRVATVDNFQGEEAKIIIISLVRSNKGRKVGFLKTTNRINVLLSRAQHGMYLIGNADTYSNVPMWRKVIDMLRAKDTIGPSMSLCCPRHTDTPIEVKQPEDFAKVSPEGGCREACIDRLPDCGHRCQARCHSKAMHEVFNCEQPCQRRHRPCDHPCQKQTCGEDCGRCVIVLNNVQLLCGHTKDNVSCYRTQTLGAIECNIVVNKKIPRCGHTIQVQCSEDVSKESYRCPTPCDTVLTCGHTCPGTCGHCNVEEEGVRMVKHRKCNKVCGRPFNTCNHTCPRACHDGSDCGLCMAKCEVACKHSRCTLKCHEACAPCIERCTWSCEHQGDCTLPCSAPCNRLPCNERCTKLLPCTHQCPGICGEECLPDYCQACEMQLDAQVDMIEFKEYREINLDENPVIALACGHFFTCETLDGMIGLDEVYRIDPVTGNILGLKDISSQLAPALPKCPSCQRPIRQYVSQRYNRLINRAVIDEMSKRFVVSGQSDLQEIEGILHTVQAELEDSRLDVISPNLVRPSTGANERLVKEAERKLQTRYKACAKLRSRVLDLQRRAAEQHQPARKLHEATVHAMQMNAPLESALKALKLEHTIPVGGRDHGITFGAKLMEVKIEHVTLVDKFQCLSTAKAALGDSAVSLKFPGGSPLKLVTLFFQSCANFIDNCNERALLQKAVEASLCYAQVARLHSTCRTSDSTDREIASRYKEKARALLEGSAKLCERGFKNADSLLRAVNESLKLLGKEFYEEVTAEELEAIKMAMVSGREGIATHSGHWYNCLNGHPFAIGECGMPMEIAKCPECGAKIGGQDHQAVQGVTRAENME